MKVTIGFQFHVKKLVVFHYDDLSRGIERGSSVGCGLRDFFYVEAINLRIFLKVDLFLASEIVKTIFKFFFNIFIFFDEFFKKISHLVKSKISHLNRNCCLRVLNAIRDSY
jgi:hypothetical protein